MGYVYLSLAIVAEVIGTSAIKASEEFTKPGPTILVILGYGIAFYMLSFVLRTIPVGVAYAIWSGLGTSILGDSVTRTRWPLFSWTPFLWPANGPA